MSDDTTATVRSAPAGRYARTLEAIVRRPGPGDAVYRDALGFGDHVVVRTRNSVYSMWAMGDGTFAVSGGWFDKRRLSPARVSINGCTYGGSVIRADVVAVTGLFLEFGNRVSTTRIRSVNVVRHGEATELAN